MQITIAYRIDDYQLDEAPKKNQTKNRMYKDYCKWIFYISISKKFNFDGILQSHR